MSIIISQNKHKKMKFPNLSTRFSYNLHPFGGLHTHFLQHCSAYFCASAHRAIMLKAVVKLSHTGTLLSVQVTNIQ